MCRVIAWAMPDVTRSDALLDSETYKRGMIVEIVDDGLELGSEVDASPWWRVLELPGVPAAQFRDLLGSDPGFGDGRTPRQPQPTFLRKRVRSVDLDAIEKGHVLTPSDTITLTAPALRSKVRTEVALTNPAVIGKPLNEIG